MADQEDQESRTEEPTEKRIRDAVEKGNVPIARDAGLFGSLAALTLCLVGLSGWAAGHLALTLQGALEIVGDLRIEDREAAARFFMGLLVDISLTIIPLLGLLSAGTVLASLFQNSPSIATERTRLKLARISLLAGWKRLFGAAGIAEFLKSVVKISAVAVILWFLFKRDLPKFVSALSAEPSLLPGLMRELATGALTPLLLLALALAIGDLVWSRRMWRRGLRMTHQQLKDEMKESEGDPLIKARIRSIGRQRIAKRMLEKLPQASVVITNPTHFAVALRYVREEGGAPVVVAKGVDHIAMKIREIADEHSIPMVENRPLARGLYDQVEIDQQIPPEFYRAVAEIIHYLNNRGRWPRHQPTK